MMISLDGKVTGNFLSGQRALEACQVYYELNRQYKNDGASGFICGRVTMEGSFTGGYYPDLSAYTEIKDRVDFVPNEHTGFYAVAFDTAGKLGWKSDGIIDPDADPGYDGAQIIEVVSERVDGRYLSYLKEKNIAYIFAGKERIDVKTALEKLSVLFGIERILLEGGSIINGAFLRADCVDELSLVMCPTVAEKDDKPLFSESVLSGFELMESEKRGNIPVMHYKKQ